MLWEHEWAGHAIVQPAVTGDGDVLISTADAMGALGMRRLAARRGACGLDRRRALDDERVEAVLQRLRRPQGPRLRLRRQHPRGIDLADGERKWKGGRYGNGQLVLLADQDLLLVLSEEGELALVTATPDKFTEIARFKAIEGKTWNHPVLVGDVLLVRNGEEMAAFRLPLARR